MCSNASPITSVVENQDADVKNNEAVNPSSDTIKRCEIYKALSDDEFRQVHKAVAGTSLLLKNREK